MNFLNKFLKITFTIFLNKFRNHKSRFLSVCCSVSCCGFRVPVVRRSWWPFSLASWSWRALRNTCITSWWTTSWQNESVRRILSRFYCVSSHVAIWPGWSVDGTVVELSQCLRSTYSWRLNTYVGKPSAVGQPTRPTQTFILSGTVNE